MLALICLFPVFGFVILALLGTRVPRRIAGLFGCSTIAASGVLLANQLGSIPAGGIRETIAPWIEGVGPLTPQFAFHLDALSATMAGIVCFVGFLIHFYSTEYMSEDAGHNRFFAYLNLFVGAMLVLLLADDLLLLFLGWEGVGLCSYLLIGFWHEDESNVRCAQKAFYVTRIGDIAFMIALFLVFATVGDWSLGPVLEGLSAPNAIAAPTLTLIATLFLIAAIAKSAQFPLQIWLPDAMAGPTPVSALLHSSTMVTAGVYLIARLHPLFLTTPLILHGVAIVGAVTAVYAGITALGQYDIKRLLAYSTISQIGYMFLALGVGAFNAAVFHFFTHAFFKALLFLGAGAVIHAVHGEQDIRKLGGLRRPLPLTFWTFVVGSAALAALPLVTSGFYSKDAILWATFAGGHRILWIMGLGTALLTGWYSARMVLMTFFGPAHPGKIHLPGGAIGLPLAILALCALVAGFLETPASLGGIHLWGDWIGDTFGATAAPDHEALSLEILLQGLAAVAALGGIGLAVLIYKRQERVAVWLELRRGALLQACAATGFYLDRIYQRLFVDSFEALSRLLEREWIDSGIDVGLSGIRNGQSLLRRSQSGRVRWYAAGLVIGGMALAAGVILL